jgi:hypothetical protein
MTTRWSRGFETLRALLDPRAEIPFEAPPDHSRGILPAPDYRLPIPDNRITNARRVTVGEQSNAGRIAAHDYSLE